MTIVELAMTLNAEDHALRILGPHVSREWRENDGDEPNGEVRGVTWQVVVNIAGEDLATIGTVATHADGTIIGSWAPQYGLPWSALTVDRVVKGAKP